MFQTPGAIAIAACPGFQTVLVTAPAPIMRVLNSRQVEILLPIGSLFQQGSGTIADFDPPSGVVGAKSGIFHIVQVFAFGD